MTLGDSSCFISQKVGFPMLQFIHPLSKEFPEPFSKPGPGSVLSAEDTEMTKTLNAASGAYGLFPPPLNAPPPLPQSLCRETKLVWR